MSQGQFAVDEFDQNHVSLDGWSQNWLRKTIDKEMEGVVQSPNSVTDAGFTTLESGQPLKHHPSNGCAGQPCALHNPIPGPWEDWPRWYRAQNLGIYRVCPHDISHPAVEQVVFWLNTKRPQEIAHACCDICVCMPRATFPDSYFEEPVIGVPSSLQGWTTKEKEEVDWSKAVESTLTPEIKRLDEPVPVRVPQPSLPLPPSKEKNPNWWAAKYLEINRLSMNPELYALLYVNMLQEHRLTEVDQYNDTQFEVTCDDECNIYLNKVGGHGPLTIWRNTGDSWCPVVEIALLAGWVPEQWEEEDGNTADENKEKEMDP